MKSIALALLALALCASQSLRAESPAPWQQTYAGLLKKYAAPGGVRYAAWVQDKADVAALRDVANAIAAADVSGLGRDEKLAFYINAYNAWMLHEVIDAYPIKSVTEIALLWGIFTQKRIKVAGGQMSLNNLEKQIIIREFGDPRIHFAINCASRSCPPLQPIPFAARGLDAQLTAAARAFLSDNPLGLRLDGRTAYVSEIFKWYGDDFAKAGGVAAFINKYRTPKLPPDAAIKFQNYDWSLNSAE